MIEHRIDGVLERNGQKYICVEDLGTGRCDACDLKPAPCMNLQCSKVVRQDSKYVIYKKYEEPKMNKVYFENEEEFKKFMLSLGYNCGVVDGVRKAKENGYIKKSVVDQAKELYHKYNPNGGNFDEHHILIELQCSAIQYLEKQLNKK